MSDARPVPPPVADATDSDTTDVDTTDADVDTEVTDSDATDATAAAADSTDAATDIDIADSIVIEDGVVRRRIRRPLDLARFVVAILVSAGIVLLAYFATSTTAGLDSDIVTGASLLPDVVTAALNIVGGIGTLGLPVAAAVMLTLRRRLRQLVDALVATLLAIVVLTALAWALSALDDPRVLVGLAGSASEASAATAPVLGGLVAFVTVTRLAGRRPWNALAVLVIGSLVAVTVLSAGIALAGVTLSMTIGWAVGLATRYAAGTPTTRPSGVEVADALTRGGYPVTVLTARESTTRGRRYHATTRSGTRLVVTVLDRDLEGAGLARAAWASLRLRDDTATGTFDMRRTLDHAALVAYAAQIAGARTPRLLLCAEIGPDSVLLAHEEVEGTRFSELPEVTDDDLDGAWTALAALHGAHLSHRGLSADHLLRADDGTVWLIGGETGSIAAGDIAQRIDVAELLTTLALLSDVDRATASGARTIGIDVLTRALPALQPVVLSARTLRAIRRHRAVLAALRDRLLELRPGTEVEQIQFERIRPRTLVMLVVGTIAGYVLISQLVQVDLIGLLRSANWAWLAGSFVLTILTFVAAAWSLSGFVPERLPLGRTILAQLAGSFATLVSPPTIGSIAINLRYLLKSGVHPALAAASVGVAQVMAFVFHILLLTGFGIVAGTRSDHSFAPPRWALAVGVIVLVLAIASLAVPAVRRLIRKRVGPSVKEAIPRLLTVAQRPSKLLEGIGGILLLNLAFIGVLVGCVEAFGGSMSIAVVAVVYLAGATLGQAAPTPGGLGAVEAALAAGLTAGGLDAGIAVSAVLAFRLLTFWLPTIPGYWAFNWLTRKGAL